MTAFFLVGTFWFWALLSVSFIAITTLSEIAEPSISTIVAIVTILILQFFGGVPIFQWLMHNPKELCLYLVLYLIAGIGYAIVKWSSFVRKEYTRYPSSTKIRVDEHSARIIGWMSFWPCNLIWTIINDPVRRLFEFIFEFTKSIFQKISDRAFERAKAKKEQK